MSKLLLGIDGSPRAKGNTAFLLDVAMKAAEEKGEGAIRTEIIHLRDYKIAPCIGCFGCTTNAWVASKICNCIKVCC